MPDANSARFAARAFGATALLYVAGAAWAQTARLPTGPVTMPKPSPTIAVPPRVLSRPNAVDLKPDTGHPIELAYELPAGWTVTPTVSGGLTSDWQCTSGPWRPDMTGLGSASQQVKCLGVPKEKSVTLKVKVVGNGTNAGKSFMVSSYGWSGGDCSGTTGETCTLSMDKPHAVAATLWDMSTARYHLTVVGDGSVTVDGQPCTSTAGKSVECVSIVDIDSIKTLVAKPGPGQVLLAWKQILACPAPTTACVSAVKGTYGASLPIAEFGPRPPPVTIRVDVPMRAGRVEIKGPDAATSKTCTNDTLAGRDYGTYGDYCTLSVPWGTPLTWTATPAANATFTNYILSNEINKQMGPDKCPITQPCKMVATMDMTVVAVMKSGLSFGQLLIEWNNEPDIDHDLTVSPASERTCKDNNCQWLLPFGTEVTITYHKRKKSTGEIVKFYGPTGFNADQCPQGVDAEASTCKLTIDKHRQVYLGN